MIEREQFTEATQKVDVKMTYSCDNTWTIRSKTLPTYISETNLTDYEVNATTCDLLPTNTHMNNSIEVPWIRCLFNESTCTNETFLGGMPEVCRNSGHNCHTYHKLFDLHRHVWTALTVTLFSVMVSGGLLASYTPATFYTGIVLLVGTMLRPMFVLGSWQMWIWDVTTPDPVIKVIEAVHLHRHEEDLAGEEECYRLLQETFRQPEFFKAITGTSLKGGKADPVLDKMSKEQQDKLEVLNKLEQKGFDVEALKNKMTGGGREDTGEQLEALDDPPTMK